MEDTFETIIRDNADIKDKLFIDWYDRPRPMTYTFEHVADQTKFLAHERQNLSGARWPVKALFELSDGKAQRLGLQLEKDLKSEDGYIWFDRTS